MGETILLKMTINNYEIKEKACPVQLQVTSFFNAEHMAGSI